MSYPAPEWRLLLQPFADDISAAVAHRTRRHTIVLAEALVAALLRVLKKPGSTAAVAKCHNFIVDGNSREVIQAKDDRLSGAERRHKKQRIKRMSQDLERLRRKMSGKREFPLPFPLTYSFTLLGPALD